MIHLVGSTSVHIFIWLITIIIIIVLINNNYHTTGKNNEELYNRQ